MSEAVEKVWDIVLAARQDERERCAKLIEDLMNQEPRSIYGREGVRAVLSIAARAIRRGRHLTDREKVDNLARAMEDDGDAELGARIRRAAGIPIDVSSPSGSGK